MKIKNIACTQFAGSRDRSVEFSDGINVVYGKNESGKSTLVNLISRTLFQNSRIDGRSDKEFRDLYFPAAVKGKGPVGDFADGKISFDTQSGVYTLSKEWGSDSRCVLSTPDGVIKDQKTIDAVLREVLVYGEGVYSDMLFSSQRNTDAALQTILDAAKKTDAKQEIVNSVSRAFSESGGISLDEAEQAINAKIEEIGGKHWDFEKEIPVRRAGRWAVGLGEILRAYYALEDARASLDEISRTEAELDLASEAYNRADGEVNIAEKAYNEFNACSGRLALRGERKKAAERIEKELGRLHGVLEKWPKIAEELEKARALRKEQASREISDKYEAAKKINDELSQIDEDILNRECPSEEETARAKAAQRDIAGLENKLCGMNLSAAISLLDGHSIEITSLRTGEKTDVSGGRAEISEAVRVAIPGVAEILLCPKDVDACDINAKIDEQKKILSDIFGKYRVENADELEKLAKEIGGAKAKYDNIKSRLDILMNGEGLDELKSRAEGVSSTIRSREEIEKDIFALCLGDDISKFITARETVIAGYSAEYKSIGELRMRACELEAEYDEAKNAIEAPESIPEEYMNIEDPEAKLEALQAMLKARRSEREKALTEKTAAAERLKAYSENAENDPKEEVRKAERIYNEAKSLLKHWLHIAEVFKAQKEKINNNPMSDIAESLTSYLGRLSGNKISSELPEADKLNMNIYSDNRLLDYGKLSEGTKETVSLAFRLAVLDHLFPKGGGVIVLDDPLTDMDKERAERSCELIKECAKRHQVIFLTCREEYSEILGGNIVRI